MVREGTQEERFVEVKKQIGVIGSDLERQSSEKLRRKLNELKNVKLHLGRRIDEADGNLEQFASKTCSRVLNPSSPGSRSTPISSPTLVQEVLTMSSIRRHSSRVKSRRPEVTPYPRFVELESDQELSLTPTESEDGSVENKENLNVTRKIDFNVEDDDNSVFEQSSQLLEENLNLSFNSVYSNDSRNS